MAARSRDVNANMALVKYFAARRCAYRTASGSPSLVAWLIARYEPGAAGNDRPASQR
jgi:poly(A) polymerase Pap1